MPKARIFGGMTNWVHIFFVSVSCLILLSACRWLGGSSKEWNPEGFYSLSGPSYLSETNRLSSSASLQLQNLYEDVYVILHASKWDSLHKAYPEDDLLDFFNLHQDNVYQRLESPQITGPDSFATAHFTGLRGLVEGNYKGNRLTHQLILLQDSIHLFQLLQWMPSAEWKQKEEDMEKMIVSLKKLSSSDMP